LGVAGITKLPLSERHHDIAARKIGLAGYGRRLSICKEIMSEK